MHLLGLSFILFLFKLYYGPRIWTINSIRNKIVSETTTLLYKRATSTERLAKKLKKDELDLRYLITSHDKDVYPKFTLWKKLKTHNSIKEQNRFSC